ncbi:MAG: hypothetical protein BGO11_21360 [Solirubrobacterales bacterium 70-9]|nr:MAG: hypothetical protein BGO11_21360 [Solirubrobacterales bacterium 70-9]
MFRRANNRYGHILGILTVATAIAVSAIAASGAWSAPSDMSLVFDGEQAHLVAGNVAVPVHCSGDSAGFCTGSVTLSHGGKYTTIPFSVQGGRDDSLIVPLALGAGTKHPRKVHGIATTVQPRGPATSSKEILYAR